MRAHTPRGPPFIGRRRWPVYFRRSATGGRRGACGEGSGVRPRLYGCQPHSSRTPVKRTFPPYGCDPAVTPKVEICHPDSGEAAPTSPYERPHRRGCDRAGGGSTWVRVRPNLTLTPRGARPACRTQPRCGCSLFPLTAGLFYLVDPASNIDLHGLIFERSISTHGRYSETANGSLNQLWSL